MVLPLLHRFFLLLGEYFYFLNCILSRFFKNIKFFKRSISYMVLYGNQSFFIVFVTIFFVGMAFSLQVLNELLKLGASDLIGGVVGMAMWRELCPVFVGVVMAGRVGAFISSELATMKVTEQIDALTVMSLDPIVFLVLPRFFALAFIMPFLVGYADFIGFFAGFFVSVFSGHVNPYAYFDGAFSMVHISDILYGLIKGLFFAVVIVVVSCYKGLNASSGAKGVGLSTTSSIVLSMVVIFVLNFFLSQLFF